MNFYGLYRLSFYFMLTLATLAISVDATDNPIAMLYPPVVAAVGVVLEGRARQALPPDAAPPPGVRVLTAPGSGDDALVDLVEEVAPVLDDEEVVLVTADRGLRARVVVRSWGPGWLRALLDDHGDDAGSGRTGR